MFRRGQIPNLCLTNFRETYMSTVSEIWVFLRMRKQMWLLCALVWIYLCGGIRLLLRPVQGEMAWTCK